MAFLTTHTYTRWVYGCRNQSHSDAVQALFSKDPNVYFLSCVNIESTTLCCFVFCERDTFALRYRVEFKIESDGCFTNNNNHRKKSQATSYRCATNTHIRCDQTWALIITIIILYLINVDSSIEFYQFKYINLAVIESRMGNMYGFYLENEMYLLLAFVDKANVKQKQSIFDATVIQFHISVKRYFNW